MSHRASPSRLVLAFDTGSPRSSVAIARGDTLLGEAPVDHEGSSESLLAQADALLRGLGARPSSIDAVCVLRGPGSFTGLRVGLATALGLHQALGIPVAAMPTLRLLAEAGAAATPVAEAERDHRHLVAVVDALRGRWFLEVFRRTVGGLESAGPPAWLRADELEVDTGACLVGFGADRLAVAADLDPRRAMEPPLLAGVAARLATSWPVWDPALLTEPLYLRPPSVTPPGRARSGGAPAR